MDVARRLWTRIETIHAVTYFAPESISAAKGAGLRGFWMGYFGFRAAPLGAVGAGTVEAAFANFAPTMVRRSIPDAWRFAQPGDLVAIRSDAAGEALRRLAPGIDRSASVINDALARIVEEASSIGRPLFAANRDIARLPDPVAQLWQHCTTLREHRGDGHVIALAAADVDGCQAHQLLIAAQRLPAHVFRDNRGWSDEQWHEADERLRERGLLAADALTSHALTSHGRRVHDEIEQLTDSLAGEPIARALSAAETEALTDALTPMAIEIAASGVLPFPNPMGLPRVA